MTHTYYQNLYHLIWSTKERKPLLPTQSKHRIFEYLAGASRTAECLPIQIGGMSDHVHLLVAIPPKHTVSNIVRDLKICSTKWIKGVLPDSQSFAWQEETRIVTPNLNSLLSMMHFYRIPGVSLAVIQGQTVMTFDWGVKNSSLANPVTSSTVFEVASLTKPLIAYLSFKLCEKGVLELDRPMPPLEENLPPINLRQILSHTAGFQTENRKVGDPLSLISSPGSCFAYSGEGFCYLGHVIEHLTDTSLASLTRELVFKPLHMEDSSQ